MSDREGNRLKRNGLKTMINDLLKTTTLVVVSPADLKEFALQILNEAKKTNWEDNTLYTTSEFAKRHNVSTNTLWRWCKMGILKPTKIGGKVWYKESDLRKEENVCS